MQHLETHKESFISVNESLHVSDNSSYLDVKEESKSCRLVGFTKKQIRLDAFKMPLSL